MDRWFQSNTINGEVRQLNRPFSSSSHFSSSAYWYWFKKLITVADWWMPWISTNTVVWNLLRSFWQTRRTCSVCKGRSEDLIRFMINSLSVKRHPKRYINTNPDWLKWQMLWALSCLISPVECIANREWLLFLSLKKKICEREFIFNWNTLRSSSTLFDHTWLLWSADESAFSKSEESILIFRRNSNGLILLRWWKKPWILEDKMFSPQALC